MGEFGVEAAAPAPDDTQPVPRVAASLIEPVPVPPLPSAPPLWDAEAPRVAPPIDDRVITSAPERPAPSARAFDPEAGERAVASPSAAAVVAAAAAAVAGPLPQGRWVVPMAVLALLTLAQAPFVVLWALQAANGPAPIAIEVPKPPVAFANAPRVPDERTLKAAPRPAPAAAPVVRPPAGSLSGWLRVDVPVPMRISEDGRLLGTTDVDRLMLPAGDHVLDLRSEELGYTTRQAVTIKPGDTTSVLVRLPLAPISINARPWAEVWIDGERVGETPIGTLMRTIGRHEVVLRHPELGERRVPVVIALGQPARLSVDFRAGK